jgi:hypothetical protein
VLGALLYFMMQSDWMKKQSVTESVATENVATSLDFVGYSGEEDDLYPGEEDVYGDENVNPGGWQNIYAQEFYPGDDAWDEEPSLPGDFDTGEDWENEGYADEDDDAQSYASR